MNDYDYQGSIEQDGFKDPDKQFPRREYMNVASTNFAARGIKRNNLYIGGGHIALDLGLREGPQSLYPMNQVRESISGHVTEIDDTPGNERMLFKHKTGAGVELRADGTVIIASVHNTIRVSGGDEKVIIEGNGEVVYNGNLSLKVAGDFELDVGGNFNVTTGGDIRENIKGNHKKVVTKNATTEIIQNKTDYVAGSCSETILRDKTSITKGASSEYVEGNKEIFVGYKDPDDGTGDLVGDFIITTANTFTTTSDNINILARDLSAVADEGVIGGTNIIMHNYNMYTGHSVDIGDTLDVPQIYFTRADGTTVYSHLTGDVTGKADNANQSDYASTAGQSPLGPAGAPGNNTADPAPATIPVDATTRVLNGANSTTAATRVDGDDADEYLHKGDLGIRNVRIDISNDLRNSINKSEPYGGLSTRKLTTPEIRAKLRDNANLGNDDFKLAQQLEGKLNAEYHNRVPTETGRIVNKEGTPSRPANRLRGSQADATKRVTK